MAQLVVNPSRDTVISQTNSTFNYGAATTGVLGKNGTSRQHVLLTFDVSGLPVGATIKGAVLGLYVQNSGTGSGNRAYDFYRLKRTEWIEGTGNGSDTGDGATYVVYDDLLSSWQTSGGLGANDYDSSLVVNGTMPTTTSAYWETSGFKAMVQDAIASRSNLLHIIGHAVGSNSETATIRFREHATANTRPILTITYSTRPPGGTLLFGDL